MGTTVTTSPPTDQATLSCIRCGSGEFDNITADRVWGTCRDCGLDVDLQAAGEYAAWLASEHARGELAFVPEQLYCPQCRTERTVQVKLRVRHPVTSQRPDSQPTVMRLGVGRPTPATTRR